MDLLSRNVHGNVPAPKWYHHNLRLTDGLTKLTTWLDIVPMPPDIALHCGMHPAGRVNIS